MSHNIRYKLSIRALFTFARCFRGVVIFALLVFSVPLKAELLFKSAPESVRHMFNTVDYSQMNSVSFLLQGYEVDAPALRQDLLKIIKEKVKTSVTIEERKIETTSMANLFGSVEFRVLVQRIAKDQVFMRVKAKSFGRAFEDQGSLGYINFFDKTYIIKNEKSCEEEIRVCLNESVSAFLNDYMGDQKKGPLQPTFIVVI